MASLPLPLERSVEMVTSPMVVEIISEEETTASPDGSRRFRSGTTWPLVLLGNVVWGISPMISKLSVFIIKSTPTFSPSEKLLVVPASPCVAPSTSERDPPAVLTSACMVVAWVKILMKGEVVARVRGGLDSALGVVGGVTAVVVERTAVVIVVDASVGGGCVVMVVVCVVVVAVVVVVVVKARMVGGKGVIFLVGGGMVGVGGLNLMME